MSGRSIEDTCISTSLRRRHCMGREQPAFHKPFKLVAKSYSASASFIIFKSPPYGLPLRSSGGTFRGEDQCSSEGPRLWTDCSHPKLRAVTEG